MVLNSDSNIKKEIQTLDRVAPDRIDRRAFFKSSAAAITGGLLAGCSGGGREGGGDGGDGGDGSGSAGSGEDLTELKVIEDESSVHAIYWLTGTQNNVWHDYGIDVSVEVGSWQKSNQAIIAGNSEIGGMSTSTAIQSINQGENLTVIGNKLPLNNEMITKTNSGISDVPGDLRDAKIGVPFETSATTTAFRGLLMDMYDFDIMEDPKSVNAAAPPVLWKQIEQDNLDVVLQFDTYTVRAQTRDDYKTLMNPYDVWTGDEYEQDFPAPTSLIMAERAWLEENPQTALDFLSGWQDTLELTDKNIDEAISRFGRWVGIEDGDQVDVITQWVGEGRIHAPVEYSQEYIDSNWKFLELMEMGGGLESVPDKDVAVTHDTIREWANE